MISKIILSKLSNFISKMKVLVVGDLMLDKYIYGDVIRIAPEAPIPIVNIRDTSSQLGGAGNVVRNLHAAGCKEIHCAGMIGSDPAGKEIKHLLGKLKVQGHFIHTNHQIPTITKTRVMAYYQHLRRISPLIRIDEEKRCELPGSLNKRILKNIIKVMDRMDLVILSDYDKGFLTQYLCKGLIEEAKLKNKKIFVDPKGSNILKYEGCFAITPNQKEWETINGETYQSVDDILKNGMDKIKSWGVQEIYVTLGDKGSIVLTSDKKNHIAPIRTEVIEVSGAGDTFITYLALSRTAGFDSAVSAAIGNIAAGLRVSKQGTEVTTLKEINEWVLANKY